MSQETVSEQGATVEVIGQGPQQVVSGRAWNLTVWVSLEALNQSAPLHPIGINITEICVSEYIIEATHSVQSCFGLQDQWYFLTEGEQWNHTVTPKWWANLSASSQTYLANVSFGVVWDVIFSIGNPATIEYWSESFTILYHYTATPPPTPPIIPIPSFPHEAVFLALTLTIGIFVFRRRKTRQEIS
jgi:hypothetical protein